MFQLSREEFANWISQIVISNPRLRMGAWKQGSQRWEQETRITFGFRSQDLEIELDHLRPPSVPLHEPAPALGEPVALLAAARLVGNRHFEQTRLEQ